MSKRFVFNSARRCFHSKLKLALAGTLIFIYLFLSIDKPKQTGKKIIYSDTNVDTSSYSIRYSLISKYKSNVKYEPGIKQVIPDMRASKPLRSRSNEILVVEYTKIFGATKYCQFFDNVTDYADALDKVYVKECPYKNCIFSCNQNLVNDAHSLLFHLADLENLVSTNPSYLQNLKESVRERKNQIWILWNDEANQVGTSLDDFKFNWTMSYRLDSEVSDCSYGCKYSKRRENEDKYKDDTKLEFLKRKNSAVWFVSNCGPRLRLEFAKELIKHFPVNVYGNCANEIKEKSFFNFFSNDNPTCDRDSGCEYEELTRTKFYLSFESKNCTNYLTEKVWKMLHIGIIPVVFQPNKEFYEINLPPNSFIHAQDFGHDAKKLAKHLIQVSEDFDLYYSYLKWKVNYDVVFSAYQTERRRLCELCTKLNTESSVIYYDKVSDFFNSQCIIN